MKEQKKEGGKSRSRFADAFDGSSHPAIDCGNQYSTSVSALQGELEEKFLPKKKRSLRLAELYRELAGMYAPVFGEEQLLSKKFQNRADRVEGCGSFLEFHVTEQEKKLHKGNFCKDRMCPMCNWRRSLKTFGQVSQIMDVLEARGYRFLFLTLTVRNCSGDDFLKTVQMMYDGWRTLYHDYFRKNKALKAVICGTFRSLEVTINKKKGEFHPHFHVILAVKPEYFTGRAYIKQAQWAEMWRACCGLDYKPIVDIRTVKPRQDKQTGEMSVAGAVAEVSKYAAKDADYLGLDDDGRESQQLDLLGRDRTYYLRVLALGLKGRRLVDMTGCFREVKSQLGLDDTENGDLVHVEKEEIREDVAYLIVKYQWRNGVYVETFDKHEPTIEDKLKLIGNLAPTDDEMGGL